MTGSSRHGRNSPLARELAPGLLIAMPRLDDPNFERAVVLMVAHGEAGSIGLVLNQPTEILTHELLANLELHWQGDRTSRVHKGGPVEMRVGWVLHSPVLASQLLPTTDGSKPMALLPGLQLSTSPQVLRSLAMRPPEHLRIMLGHSGWGPGQLAQEIGEGAWIFADATPELVFETPPSLLWEKALNSAGLAAESLASPRGGVN